jgi:hypothetical protein
MSYLPNRYSLDSTSDAKRRKVSGNTKRLLTLPLLRHFKIDHCGSPAACFRGSVAESHDERSSCEDAADDFALHADTAPVNDSEGCKTEAAGFDQIFFHDCGHVAWGECVEIENVSNGDTNRLNVLHENRLGQQMKRAGEIACPTIYFQRT